jgi:sugar phosphate isomerase/epimerase
MNRTRRSFLKSAAAAAAAASAPSWALPGSPASSNKSFYKGVQLGVQTYSFHDIPNDGTGHADDIIRNMLAAGVYDCELFGGPVVPSSLTGKLPDPALCPHPTLGCAPGKGGSLRNPWAWVFARYTGDQAIRARERQKKFYETTPMSYFSDYRAKFDKAGINIHAYNPLVSTDMSDLEIDRLFESGKALNVKSINLSTKISVLRKLAPLAEKHQLIVAAHGHGAVWDRDEISDEESFTRALNLSPWVGANLDIGHYVALGGDPIDFIDKYHDRIVNLHVKDRQLNQKGMTEETGDTVAWGLGKVDIKGVLKHLQAKKYNIPAFIEYEHASNLQPVEEVKKEYETCKQMLDS